MAKTIFPCLGFSSLSICLPPLCCFRFSFFRGKTSHQMDVSVRYRVIEIIGQGCFCKCRDSQTSEMVIIKTINYGHISSNYRLPVSVQIELSFSKSLKHENILRLHYAKKDIRPCIHLVFESLDTDLHEFINSPCNVLDSQLIKWFLYQILSGISYCHSLNVVHRDIRPRNLLIDLEKRTVKIANFRSARDVRFPYHSPASYPEPAVIPRMETLGYTAPEILLGSTKYSTSTDMWAVGCIFAEMVTGNRMFYGMWDIDILSQIFSFFGMPDEDICRGLTSLTDLGANISMFTPDSSQSLDEVIGLNKFDSDGVDLLSRMLCLDPNMRITAQNALAHAYFKDINYAYYNF